MPKDQLTQHDLLLFPCDINLFVYYQAAVPQIIQQTKEAFFGKTLTMLKQTSDICYETIKEIPCVSCPFKPEGSMAMMVSIYYLFN